MSTNWKPGDRIIGNLEALKAEVDAQDPVEREDDEWEKQLFIGTVMSLTPSSKFYTPFANSNVERCPQCKGQGTVPNPHAKTKSHDRAHRKAMRLLDARRKAYGPYQFSASGPVAFPAQPEAAALDAKIRKAVQQRTYYQRTMTCPMCHGVGSYEAYLDEEWYAQLEAELSSVGLFYTHGEGDPCDIFVGKVLDDDDTFECADCNKVFPIEHVAESRGTTGDMLCEDCDAERDEEESEDDDD